MTLFDSHISEVASMVPAESTFGRGSTRTDFTNENQGSKVLAFSIKNGQIYSPEMLHFENIMQIV